MHLPFGYYPIVIMYYSGPAKCSGESQEDFFFVVLVFDYDRLVRSAAKLAKEVAAEGGALTLGGISQTPTFLSGAGKEEVQAEFRSVIINPISGDYKASEISGGGRGNLHPPS